MKLLMKFSLCFLCAFCSTACRRITGEDGNTLVDGPDSESEAAGETEPADRGSDSVAVDTDTGTAALSDSDSQMDSDTGLDTESKAVCESELYEACCINDRSEFCDDLDRAGGLPCAIYYCCIAFDPKIALLEVCSVVDCVYPPVCGDGEMNQDGEECDDGNTIPGDGCTGICKMEYYYNCPVPGQPCIPTIVCGDGVRDPGEACDDGNAMSGDGCPSDCVQEEPCYLCRFPGRPCEPFESLGIECPSDPFCGDGKVDELEEECDDYFNLGGYAQCAPGCVWNERCGDGIVHGDAGETCDEGEENGAFGKCTTRCNGLVGCGDGIVQSSYGEACDDGVNIGVYDGCTADCLHAPHCGDDIVQPSFEACDDGDENGNYGKCNWNCTELIRCGDGIRQSEEACDDGNNVEDDFCDSLCRCGAVVGA